MAKQAESWAEVKPYLDTITKKVKDFPAPPKPQDGWSEKLNTLNRTVEGMNEHLDSLIQQEEEMA
jgi:hypothetical protein